MLFYVFRLTRTDAWIALSKDERARWLQDRASVIQETAVTLPDGSRSGIF